MKKAIYVSVIATLLVITSCHHNSTTTNLGGTWTFKGTTYNATTSIGLQGDLTVSNSTVNNQSTYGSMDFQFYGNSFPTTSGTYHIAPGGIPVNANQLGVNLGLGGVSVSPNYYSTGSNTNQTVAVTVSSTGKVSIQGSSVMLLNDNDPTDSSTVTFNVTQVQ